MTLLGLDFDNTLVHYDKLFHQLAIEKSLINISIPADKIAIRDYLRGKGQEEQFTLMQGEVYGLKILEAEPAKGMLEALKEIQRRGVKTILISHKTKTPYKGPAYDLHRAAIEWLEKNRFFDPNGLGWSKEEVFFEESKEKKVARIKSEKCTHYIDDLPEILEMLPPDIVKILYDPNNKGCNGGHLNLDNWEKLKKLI